MADFSCPLPSGESARISMAEGAGGKAMQRLIEKSITPLYGNGFAPDHDGAVFVASGRMAFTTDSYVVKPLFFPGGDIGKLAVYGTINDLAMCGAKPQYLSCSFIIEEGLPVEILNRICESMSSAAKETGVTIVTGDTKVVGRGQADGLYINTSGVGTIQEGIEIHPRHVQAGDALILSGDLGRHGIAVMAAREGLALDSVPESDCGSLISPVQALLTAGIRPRCLRDLTRGGLASALHEISGVGNVGMEVDEGRITVERRVRGACEILGLDPVYIANEGRFLAIVSPDEAEAAVTVLRSNRMAAGASIIGRVTPLQGVEMIGLYGAKRLLPPLSGELLPRIC